MGLHPSELRHVSLFTGAGGGEYAAHLLGWKTICYVERDPYCQRVIRARIADGTFDDAPLWSDVRTFDGRPWRDLVDVVSGGFPCQPWSVANKAGGADDERNLWPDTLRIIREARPRFAFLENVAGLLTGRHGYFGHILRDLAELRYDASWIVLSAARLGAPHLRKRLWLLATDAERGLVRAEQGRRGPQRTCEAIARNHGAARVATDADRRRCEVERKPCRKPEHEGALWNELDRRDGSPGSPWGTRPPKPVLRGLAYGLADRRDRLRALGNGQVPSVAAAAWRMLGGPA